MFSLRQKHYFNFCWYKKCIALPLDSLLLRGVSAGPCFCLRAWRRKHARRHVCPRDGLKAGPALTPHNNRLSSERAMPDYNWLLAPLFITITKTWHTCSSSLKGYPQWGSPMVLIHSWYGTRTTDYGHRKAKSQSRINIWDVDIKALFRVETMVD